MNATQFLRTAVGHAQGGDLHGALNVAEQGLAAHPFDPGLLGIAALAALQMGERERGAALLRRQLAVTPDDQAARTNLARVLIESGDNAGALAVARDHGNNPRLARIAGYLLQEAGEPALAAAAYRVVLAADERDYQSWNNYANCLTALGERKEAVRAFEKAINYDPAPPPEVFLNLCDVLALLDNREGRVQAMQEALSLHPGHAGVLYALGLAQAVTGQHDDALQTLARAAEAQGGFGDAMMDYGLLLENTNRLDELDALVAEQEALGAPDELLFLKAWALRRRSRFAEAQELLPRLPDTINPQRRAQLEGEIAERLGDTDRAFSAFTEMNRQAVIAFPPGEGPSFRERVDAETDAMQLPPAVRPVIGDAPDPAFIVGFPRSGTTLLDTLLSALPELQVFEEQPILSRVEETFSRIAQTGDSRTITQARAQYFAKAAQLQGEAEGRRILDKHPLHMTHMPTIHRLFPAASVVMVERHPCDVVLSCYMANFVMNPAMRSFTDLEEAARTYDAVMRNWHRAQEVLPLSVHTVRYERMIADLEGELRSLIAFLGLPWRDDVLDNQASAQRRGAVRTASYAQVGEAIYTRSVARWERYRAHLAPVLPILAPWAERMGYEI